MLDTLLAFSLVLFAPAKTRPAEPPPVVEVDPGAVPVPKDGVRIFSRNDKDYQSVAVPPDRRTAPDAESRLVVFRDGVALLDRGLRVAKRVVGEEEPSAAPMEEGIAEDAVLSPDGRYAVLATTRYRRTAPTPTGPGSAPEDARGRTELVWIDPDHPAGLWSVVLEDGRWVKKIVPLSARRGVAVSTLADPEDPDGDFRIYGPEGIQEMRIPESEGITAEIVATGGGGFVAVGILLPGRPGLPDRALTVLDLTYGTRWSYTWSYGGDDEPVSWKLGDTGILEVTTPLLVRTFDRSGKPMGVKKRK